MRDDRFVARSRYNRCRRANSDDLAAPISPDAFSLIRVSLRLARSLIRTLPFLSFYAAFFLCDYWTFLCGRLYVLFCMACSVPGSVYGFGGVSGGFGKV